ncbi:MAG: Gldg family protein [Cardiobacteriaceae bacterium]|nr:Gldg family protein [Cardiobacteriaceae bacterium]
MRHKLSLILLACLTVSALLAGAVVALRLQTVYEWRDTPQWSLTEAQRSELASRHPFTVEVYLRNNPRLRRQFQQWLAPLQFAAPRLQVHFINPDTDPLRVQDRGITREGQMYVQIGQTGKRLETPSVSALERTLLELLYQGEKQIIHIQGHGERAFLSDTPGSWLGIYQALRADNILIGTVNPADVATIPDGTDLLVIADPGKGSLDDAPWLAQYLDSGGNLLYSTDIRHAYLPAPLRALSGLDANPDPLVDAAARDYGFENPQMLVIDAVGESPALAALRQLPVIPGAVALIPQAEPRQGWQRDILLYSSDKSWAERDPLANTLSADDGEARGPLGILWQLTREHHGKTQYLWLAGDSDAWIPPYRELGGNRQWFTQSIPHLLGGDAALAKVAAPPKDQIINASQTRLYVLGALLLLGLPALAGLCGWLYFRMLKWRYRVP